MVTSAGILVYRRTGPETEFLLGHPGGPFWKHKDHGAWTILKGLVEPGEDAQAAALREFREETGLTLSSPLQPLTPVRQAGGKHVVCWAANEDLDLTAFRSGEFQMQWPPKSGQLQSFPEIDQLRFFGTDDALKRVLMSQAALLREVLACVQ